MLITNPIASSSSSPSATNGESPLNAGHWKELEELRRRNLTSIERCVVRGQQNGELKPGDPRLYAVAFLGITVQLTRQWIGECEQRTRERLGRFRR